MSLITFLVVVGVDIAQAPFDAARLAEGPYRHKQFDTTPEGFVLFAEGLARFGGESPHLGREATGAYRFPLAEFLVGRGFGVRVVNPAKIAAFAQSELSRAQTDQADAKRMAR